MTLNSQQVTELVTRLRNLDSCALSDAMDKLKVEGVVSGLMARSGNVRIAGQVKTMRLGVGQPPPGKTRHLGTDTIESANPGDVIVIEQRSGKEAGCWGGTLSLAAKLRGISGVIADGPVRDVDEAQQYEFPVYSRTITARTARGRIVQLGVDVPVAVGDVVVNAGDFAMADQSAAVFIPQAFAEEVIATAEMIVRKERLMAEALKNGTPVSEVMGANYEHMLNDQESSNDRTG